MLDKVEVVTVQGLMEYMYKGECMVKDREGLKDMSELVKMLGIDIKLEQKPRRSPDASWWGRNAVIEGSEPNLEETVQNGLYGEDESLAEKERELTDEILRFVEIFCRSDEDQKCSKCDEWLSKDTFMEHFKMHKEEINLKKFASVRGPDTKEEGQRLVKSSSMITSMEDCQDKLNASNSKEKSGSRVRKGKKKDTSSKNDNGELIKEKSKKKGRKRNGKVSGEENDTDEYINHEQSKKQVQRKIVF